MTLASAIAIRDLQINYLWPQYSLPWNNFFGRVHPQPYYTSNALRNIAIREIHSPLTYDPQTVISVGSGNTAGTAPVWTQTNATPATTKPLVNSASKIFVGTYYDTSSGLDGLTYQYDIRGTQVVIPTAGISNNFLYLAVNLAKEDPRRVNIPQGVATNFCDPCNGPSQTSTFDLCQLTNSNALNNFFSTLTGTVAVNGSCKDDGTPQLPAATFCLGSALPYKDACSNCNVASPVFWYINGNRLYIGINISGLNTKVTSITYDIGIRVVESLTPLEAALNPFANVPPYL